ncbi:MAG TPA: hypothetical protein VG079_05370 [Gaiellaceae bacterium]|jgi:hypothetical protein|nr:hypothetical protein [Gaiellaceae bacterium]
MHGRHRHRHGRGCGPGFGSRRYPNREEWLRALEEYQKDLEQEVADIDDLIRRLREERKEGQGETATV